jgi:hypothetical protein
MSVAGSQFQLMSKQYGLILKALQPNRALTLTCYVDASYLTHADSKSHTGFCLSFGEIGTFYSKSSKQTLVTTSSTHAEMRALYTLLIHKLYSKHTRKTIRSDILTKTIVGNEFRRSLYNS